MPETLELTVDKFTFLVALDRWYSAQGAWAKAEAEGVRIGLSDFLQQRSGDVAFVELKQAGEQLAFGDEMAVIETIKVNVSLDSPVGGMVLDTNPAMQVTPERINQDPYGEGWLALVQADDWEGDRLRLMDGQAYFAHMKKQAETEGG